LPDIGHACGHSLSCGVSLLTALALRKALPDAPFVFDLIGTPAEESIGGKVVMAENGAFDGYKLAIMSHIDNYHSPQARILACNDMYITFHGKPAHASSEPFDGINALNAANLFFVATDMMRQHIPRYAQYHGIITHGGSAPNIVPDRTEIDMYVRSATLKGLSELRERLTNCVKGAALATGCSYEIEQRSDTYTDMFYPKSSEREIIEIYDAFGYDYHIYEEPEGSTDMGNVDLVVPSIHLYCRGTDEFTPLHTPEIVQLIKGERGKKTLLEGTRVLASFLNEISEHLEKLDEITEEHRIYRSGAGSSN
jgi:amidohydrolase